MKTQASTSNHASRNLDPCLVFCLLSLCLSLCLSSGVFARATLVCVRVHVCFGIVLCCVVLCLCLSERVSELQTEKMIPQHAPQLCIVSIHRGSSRSRIVSGPCQGTLSIKSS